MVCSQCHTPNFRDYKYCRECGARLESSEAGPADDSAEVESLVRHAFVQMEQGELTKALGTVQAALAHDPESPSAHSALGLIYEKQGLITEAIHQFRVVLRLSPDSTADREKLEQLLARGGREVRASAFTPARLAVASAVAAGVLTFGVGLAMANANGAKQRPYQSAGTLGVGLPAAAPNLPQQPAPQPASLATMPPKLPAGPALKPVATPMPLPSYSARPAPTPVALQPAWGRHDTAQPTPPPPWQTRKPQAAPNKGLQPAQIGEVVPLSRPDLTPYAADQGEKPQLTHAPRTAESRPRRVEPLEPDTGFIKIEPEKPAAAVPNNPGPAPAGNGGNPAGENPRPSISITISPGSR